MFSKVLHFKVGSIMIYCCVNTLNTNNGNTNRPYCSCGMIPDDSTDIGVMGVRGVSGAGVMGFRGKGDIPL